MHAREALANEFRSAVGQVEKHVRRTRPAHLGDDGAGDHVSRRQFIGKALARGVPQHAALAPQRLGEQKPRRALDMQRGGVKLNEFNIADFRAGAPSHGDAVARGYVRIGSLFVHPSEASGGQQHGPRADCNRFAAGSVEHQGAGGSPLVDQQIDGGAKTAKSDRGDGGRFPVQRAGDLAAGGIAVGVQDAAAAMSGFPRKRQPHAIAIEFGAPLDEPLDGGRTFLDQRVDSLRIAQSGPGGEGVLLVQSDLVVIAERDGDSALRVFRRGFAQAVLRHHQNTACLG